MTRIRRAGIAFLLLALIFFDGRPPCYGQDGVAQYPPTGTQRLLFLGDSITYAGHFVALVEAHLRTAGMVPPLEVVNLGLPSETCTGLTEPEHPFPRPDVHERLERALTRFQPQVVVACYGMNDGIYAPFDDARFAAFQQGVNRLIDVVAATGAELVLLTPPPFDPLPLARKGKLRAADADQFDWRTIYAHYDRDVIQRYAGWVLDQRGRVRMVVDLHTPLRQFVTRKRDTDADFSLSPDGVHLNPEGHALVAAAILDAWGRGSHDRLEPALLALVQKRSFLLRDAWLSHVGHLRPGIAAGLPMDDAREAAAELDREIRLLASPR